MYSVYADCTVHFRSTEGHDQTKHWNYVSIDLHLDYFWVTNMLHLSTDQQIHVDG